MTDFKLTTAWHFFPGSNEREVFRIAYGFTSLKGNSAPYFSVTHESFVARRGECAPTQREVSFGTVSHALIDALPMLEQKEMRVANAFHLFSPTSGPMHYEENGLYLLELCSDPGEHSIDTHPDPWQAFLRHVVVGLLTTDTGTTTSLKSMLIGFDEAGRRTWLRNRLPLLQEAFASVVTALSLEQKLADAWAALRAS